LAAVLLSISEETGMHCESAKDKRLGQREKEGIRILDLQGQLKAGDSESTLRSTINALARDNVVNIILNLAEVTKIDSDGLEALVWCQTQIRKLGGALKLARVDKRHLTLSVLTKLNTVFEVFADEQDAVNSFFPDRATPHYDILEWVEEEEKNAISEP
jgi:anti-sigma B factor antagonist